jgi:hypothetical protein
MHSRTQTVALAHLILAGTVTRICHQEVVIPFLHFLNLNFHTYLHITQLARSTSTLNSFFFPITSFGPFRLSFLL